VLEHNERRQLERRKQFKERETPYGNDHGANAIEQYWRHMQYRQHNMENGAMKRMILDTIGLVAAVFALLVVAAAPVSAAL
jgi:hypothetical protein